MRKLSLILVALMLLPLAAFAQLGVGAAVFLKSPVLLGQPIDLGNQNVNQFSFGGDLRYKLGIFQAEGLLLYSAGDINSVATYLDAGIAVDVLPFLRLSVGAGPNLNVNLNDGSAVQTGLNAKIGCDVPLGPISVGLTYIMALNVANSVVVSTGTGLLGAQVLFWM